ncbi:unnamed protein product [Anisakis simplex]|uniref:SCP domain-containing protein n=1 Tax=Anisakis simplex TaxID=6269 RepID=A0A0M3JNB6_ANISI|nr:unnamed protein product [Anisakis simplex]
MYDPTVNVDSPDFAQVLQKNEQALEKYEGEGSDPDCTEKDPYWCEGYVNTYMDWQTQINNFQHEACAPFKFAFI